VNDKAGLQAVIDYTKVFLILAGGAIVFIIQPSFFGGSKLSKLLSILALLSLSTCILSGVMVFARGAVMLAQKQYDLGDVRIGFPRKLSVMAFLAGFILVALLVAMRVLRT
jgi:amino acid transporter